MVRTQDSIASGLLKAKSAEEAEKIWREFFGQELNRRRTLNRSILPYLASMLLACLSCNTPTPYQRNFITLYSEVLLETRDHAKALVGASRLCAQEREGNGLEKTIELVRWAVADAKG